jgi:hypothetical protein
MNESISEQPLSPKVAAYVGIDWADQKHDVVLRSAGDPAKPEHQVIKSEINALNDWIAQMHERFGAKGKVLVCLEQSRGALIYQLMAYELFELYPINPSQLASYRKTFFSSGAKDDGPDADLLSELLMCHRDRLKAWKPDDQLTRELASSNSRVSCLSSLSTKGGSLNSSALIPIASSLTICPEPALRWPHDC